ncbi:pseudaminic acid cytidylyltransferase [Desulfurispira natronophila]|uniref:N-acylneuraminate cytidylyltransferase n=1 Tax=Desulfurispira natronophila TaxID=682562 RepID=A0A7W7Y4Q6_9BACT|nr:pseudaminic acid cytidylyltransferase [Desulfurispira natronophila]MBB5022061.1 N-acylneuraminate cytidylyltransferase [Desulfurispira natronophila]
MNIAIIPARGGSKRIPRKNIRTFHGKPIIGWSIELALASKLFEQVIVSTDCPDIAAVAREFGAEVPFMRPAELSDDHTGTAPVVAHAIQWLADQGQPCTHACCIYATAPFLRQQYLQEGLRALQQDSTKHFAFSVTSFAFPIFRALKIENRQLGMLWPEHAQTRSQDLPEAYHDAGQFYWGIAQAWQEQLPLFASHSAPVILPRHLVQDIDTLEDWQRAELMFEVQQRLESRP